MSTIKPLQPHFSPAQMEGTTRYVERLLDGPAPGTPWPLPEQAYDQLQEVNELREIFQQRQKELMRVALLGHGEQHGEELQGIAVILWQAWRRNREIVYGGHVDWERVEQMRPLDWRRKDYFENFFRGRCREPRCTLAAWVDEGPYIGRLLGDDWHPYPDVWTLIQLVATGELTQATIRSAYLNLFEAFPSLDRAELGSGFSKREQIISNLAASPCFAIWELQQIAEALGVGRQSRSTPP